MSLTAPNPALMDDLPGSAYGEAEVSSPRENAMIAEERSGRQWMMFLPAIAFAFISYMSGGIRAMNDLTWAYMTIVCVAFLVAEFRAFSFRWGIGGLLVYGGSLVFLSYDYMAHWFANGSYYLRAGSDGFSDRILARATLAHTLFIPGMIIGLRLRAGGHIERWISKLPGPRSSRMWVVLIIVTFSFGLIPYAFFTRDGLFVSVWNDFWAGRAGGGAAWLVGRSGNANTNYGAYLAQVIQVGLIGSVAAAYYAILIARTWAGRIFGFIIWLPAVGSGFGSGTRGALLTVLLPVMGFMFIRLQATAAAQMRRVSLKAYGVLALMLAVTLVLVQTQITFRNLGFQDAKLSEVSVTEVEGNAMFSESLHGFALVPDFRPPFYSNYPGQEIIHPVIDTVYWLVVTPVPRALWTSKPIDPVAIWYNMLVGGSKDGVDGTTISNGAVGFWYFRFGMWGAIEGGIIMGFMMGVTERLLRYYGGEPLGIVASLGLAQFLFRSYRGLAWLDFHPVMVGTIGLAMFCWILRPIVGDRPAEPAAT